MRSPYRTRCLCAATLRCTARALTLRYADAARDSGGNEPGTSNKWSKPSCCPSGAVCKQINNYYSQCVKS